jgi:imidazolonepropionase-like amidohydrolase
MKLIFWLLICCLHVNLASADNLNTKPAQPKQRLLLRAARVFDGKQIIDEAEVLLVDNRIAAVGKQHRLNSQGAKIIELGDSTLLPGLIDLHTHIDFQKVNKNSVLEHGVTTARDVGGALLPLSGGDGQLRLFTAGAILTAVNGYPIPVFGKTDIAQEIATPEQARAAVREHINGGAAVIKVALDSGEESGAPWTAHPASLPAPWPLLSLEILQAITDEAHKGGKRVSAHLAENKGVALALDAGVDEWAHLPCEPIADELLQRAVAQKVIIISTLDVLSHCSGLHQNAHRLAHLGASFLYGAEIAHTDIPWGIDAQELMLMQHLLGLSPIEVLHTATAKAGEYLGLAPLGTLSANAPADIIAVRGNPLKNFKLLEYPDLVLSGGKIVVNHY